MTSDTLGEGLFAIAAALIAVAYNYWQHRKQLKIAHDDGISASKKRVIEELVAYRFVLTGEAQNDPQSTTRFNAALSAVPVHFSHNKKCMDLYRTFGTDFNPGRFYDLTMALMKDVPLDTASIDVNLLENVPRVRGQVGQLQ